VVYDSADVVVPLAGSHDVVYSAVNYTLPTGVDTLILEGSATSATGNSDAAGDTLYATNPSLAATLTGNSHNDTFVVYNSGDRRDRANRSTDTVYAAASFVLPVNVGTLFLEGTASQGAGNGDAVNALYGNAGAASRPPGRQRHRYPVRDRHRRNDPDGRRRLPTPSHSRDAMGHDVVVNFSPTKDTCSSTPPCSRISPPRWRTPPRSAPTRCSPSTRTTR